MSIDTFSHIAVQLLIKCSCVVNSIAFSARIFLVKSTNDKKKKKMVVFDVFFFRKTGIDLSCKLTSKEKFARNVKNCCRL